MQFIDVRDLTAWLLRNGDAGTQGLYNLTGPATPLTMGGFLDAARQALNGTATLRWADEDWLLSEGVVPWRELPVWLSRTDAGLHQVSITQALATGLVCRPLVQTILDTMAWATPVAAPAGVGMAPEREADLLSRTPSAL